MVLKDWTETEGDAEMSSWHKYHKNGKKLAGGQFYDGVMITKTVNGDWTFGSYYRQTPKEYHYKQGRLRTKEQAIRLAKSYMRSH